MKLDYCTHVSEDVLELYFPDDVDQHDGGVYNSTNRRVESRKETRFRDLVLSSKVGGELPPEEAVRLLSEKVVAGDLLLKKWDHKIEEIIARINLLSETFPEYEISAIDAEARQLIVEQVCEGAVSYKEIKERPVKDYIMDWIPSHHYGILDRLVPERVTYKDGRDTRVFYSPGEKPKISVMILSLIHI